MVYIHSIKQYHLNFYEWAVNYKIQIRQILWDKSIWGFCVCAELLVYMWRPEVNRGCFSLFLDIVSPTEICWLHWPANELWWSPYLCPSPLKLQVQETMSIFLQGYWGPELESSHLTLLITLIDLICKLSLKPYKQLLHVGSGNQTQSLIFAWKPFY